ncbi:undecaprenyldiphospho-muramoylpentapeptide beta-N-acetylglucosaminyltransferase [Zeaxanthinibacter enoshimensis]|uniref:UDP-N-acetylglucosamine--N-acetylmuramyl-(pentapeptide) pyrophosphoryl-undecaprenol N-acetylglucosamine transferase n=1 Tax=Zeaxanthinibacter enoshimensis TaxID=392009 RepID=A0A4R6TQB6_9FLAO|nr:undecaprenyldiphospho-muramoylpentapeptide beta-N-acetylglucosaminyltransferase [Zeaxanthinibacter enoshimensis]TDQ30680.1 UDP-N-acetylglucosamine--N-acetylmuramyl-(pentapeptide) pyrophosphoryl-undecaprenol N-acetylglucosamine transferase [Zeaxanthinibacter enoshimensis]
MGNYRFILSGGGTGGHIYPAIAIANELKKRYPDARFLFVGAKGRMEMEKVPQAGYEIKGLWITGLQRKLSLKNLMFPVKLIQSLIKAGNIVAEFKPHVAIGTGGFASGPVLQVASRKGIPCVLQEQNSFAGITNKLLAKKAEKICVAYDGMEKFFPADKVVKTGNPVRESLIREAGSKQEAAAYFNLEAERTTLVVLGGSLGSKRINELLADNLGLIEELGIQLVWQCGKGYYETYKDLGTEHIKVYDFLNRMDLAYAMADMIISRAGAGAVSELSLVGKPVILIPSPHVAEDHQTKNAQAMVDKDAAIMLRESELDSRFEAVFRKLASSPEDRHRLGNNIRKMAMPDATRRIADEIEKLLPTAI